MMKKKIGFLSVTTVMLLVFVSGCKKEEKSADEALLLIETAYKAKDYSRILSLADSLEQDGSLLSSSANYWRGYAYERMKQKDEAADYWQKSMDDAVKSSSPENMNAYVKSAARLANQLSLSGDYEGTLKMALPVIERLEALECDTTSDYVNLLIYAGLCQVSLGQSEEDAHIGFVRACAKHRENIEKSHSDGAYKDAIAGLVNIAYYCVLAKKYEQALYYTSNFGDLLIEYGQREGVDTNYVDRQVGRYTIYKSWALDRLGRKKDAEETYKGFLTTRFCQSAEGIKLAEAYRKELSEEMEEQ